MNHKITVLMCAALVMTMSLSLVVSAKTTKTNKVKIIVNTSKDKKAISPYIYGINAFTYVNNKEMTEKGTYGSIRAGGNRYSAYNWENNASNAGIDWNNCSDSYFTQNIPAEFKDQPGCIALALDDVCDNMDAYSLMTLQMAGYVAADMNGNVGDTPAPSDRFKKVKYTKGGGNYSLTPNQDDKYVYMDEFVNYLVNNLGDSKNGGIRGYSLDNEPSLWSHTHSMVHPEKTTCKELVENSIALSKAVKSVDPGAEIFGPALFGYGAFISFNAAADWGNISSANPGYEWFIDYYLDEMKKAEKENGTRLLDVLDVHFYTEAKGECGTRYCDHYDKAECVQRKLDATRSLWDDTYKENSWITTSCAQYLPLLPNLEKSIDKYYPGTKIAITEYDFGGAHDISGAIAEADALGVFAKYGVYAANYFCWKCDYPLTAIDLYTNYDKKGSSFGDTLVYCESNNVDVSTAYAAVNGNDDDTLTLVVTNKSFDKKTTATIKLNTKYDKAHLYGINKKGAKIVDMKSSSSKVKIKGKKVTLKMDPETVYLLELKKS